MAECGDEPPAVPTGVTEDTTALTMSLKGVQ